MPDLSVLAGLLHPTSLTHADADDDDDADMDMEKRPNVFALAEGMDYEDLGFNIDVLSAVLTELDDYVDAERLEKTKAGSLERLREALFKMHSAISESYLPSSLSYALLFWH